MSEHDQYFKPENENAQSRRAYLSPSGKYKLIVSSFEPGFWSYSQGKVFKQGSDTPIAVVNRNYSAFPYLFIEDHPSGHDFLVCGEDYQGQTVIDLTTGARRDSLSAGTDKGWGFCWSEHRFDKETQILVVSGCHWACPYEFRFYDFAAPMNGWPELTLKPEPEPKVDAVTSGVAAPETEVEDLGGIGMYDDSKWPTFEPDGTIRCYQTEDADSDDDYVNKPKPDGIAAHTTFRREGSKLVSLGEWVSEGEKKRRALRDENERKFEAWKAEFKKTDPLYLVYDRLVKDPAFSPEDHMSIGVIHDSWCPHYKSEGCKERRWCRRIVTHEGDKGLTINLEWGVDAGPVKITVYRDSGSGVDEFFEHSALGMERAFARAKSFVAGGTST